MIRLRVLGLGGEMGFCGYTNADLRERVYWGWNKGVMDDEETILR